MSIILVDDSPDCRNLIKVLLTNAKYPDIVSYSSGYEILEYLGITKPIHILPNVDLILLDVVMPGINGITTCCKIKSQEPYRDIPIIIITAQTEMKKLQEAFDAGATDYITKPVNKIELLSRVRSALKLKNEIDQRKKRELELLAVTKQLKEANTLLKQLSSLDGLTGIANRRHFDEFLDKNWQTLTLKNQEIALILFDIDYFKAYNDTYGHQQGDQCLKILAASVAEKFNHFPNLVARYGGEEFAVVLPGGSLSTALAIAEEIRSLVQNLHLPHIHSDILPYVTISLGTATLYTANNKPAALITKADKALYLAKQQGRNRDVAG